MQGSYTVYIVYITYSTRDVKYLFFSKLQVGNSNSNSKLGCCGLRVGALRLQKDVPDMCFSGPCAKHT